MKTTKLCLILLSCQLLTACVATLDSFRKMDEHSRTEYVCNRDPHVSAATEDSINHQQRIKQFTAALERGFLVHNSCKTIDIEEDVPVSCKKFDPASKQYTECSHERKTKQKRICSDEVVPLNVALTKENLHKHEDQLWEAQQRRTAALQRCENKVKNMNPEQAFQYFESQ